MLQKFSFSTKNHNIFVVSDLHLHHNKDFIWKKRGYLSVDDHDYGLIKKYNELVKPDDVVINLGDFIFNANIEITKEYINKLNGHMYFLWGNHNSGMKQLYADELQKQFGVTDVEIYPLTYNNKLTFVGDYMEVTINDQFIVLSHYPISIFNKKQHDAWMLCGHSHYNYLLSRADNFETKTLDVGIEGLGRPWSFKEINDVMNKKHNVELDHH